MSRNEFRRALRQIGSRRPQQKGGVALLEKRDRVAASPTRPQPKAAAEEERVGKAFHQAGQKGADLVRTNQAVALNGAGALRPTSEYGNLVSRLITRRVQQTGLSTAAVLAAAAQVGPGGSPGAMTGMRREVTPATFDPLLVLLVNRVTGGFCDAEYQLATSLGFSGYLAYHLNHTAIPDPGPAAYLAQDPTVTAGGDPTKGYFSNVADDSAEVLVFEDPTGLVFIQLLQATTIYRTILTKRMLHDRMTEFWTDHFNIDIRLFGQGLMKPVDDREVIRANALGTFPALLTASAHSTAMLFYLDQYTSSYQAPNENYARELLELHTLGEGNGYTEDDVVDVAQILCGWSANFSAGAGQFLTFQYKSVQHDPAAPSYMLLRNHPQKIPISAGGQIQGDDLLLGLGAHPLTADYISYKLLRFLLQYNPTPAQVAAVAGVYTGSGGDIKQMIQAILTPANLSALLATSPSTLKVKRPMQLMSTFLRAVQGAPYWTPGVIENPLADITDRLESLGNAPFLWGPPNGYPDAEGAWIGDLLGRWDLLDSLTRNEIYGIDVDYPTLVNILTPFTVPLTGFRLNEVLAGGAMTADEQFWIQEYVDIGVILLNLGFVSVQELVRELFAVAASAPSYQYY